MKFCSCPPPFYLTIFLTTQKQSLDTRHRKSKNLQKKDEESQMQTNPKQISPFSPTISWTAAPAPGLLRAAAASVSSSPAALASGARTAPCTLTNHLAHRKCSTQRGVQTVSLTEMTGIITISITVMWALLKASPKPGVGIVNSWNKWGKGQMGS